TVNFVADTPARSTRSARMSYPGIARLPKARFRSSYGRPTSRKAPSTMSPEIPEKQSKYSTRPMRSKYVPHAAVPATTAAGSRSRSLDNRRAGQHKLGAAETGCDARRLDRNHDLGRRVVGVHEFQRNRQGIAKGITNRWPSGRIVVDHNATN